MEEVALRHAIDVHLEDLAGVVEQASRYQGTLVLDVPRITPQGRRPAR